MATATPTKSNRTSIARPTVQDNAAPQVTVDAPSRREFMYYIWGASIALLLGELGAGLLWFAFPRFKEGEFGGTFPFNPSDLPSAGTPPQWNPGGRFHISNTENGLLALYGVCTHLGCLPKWVPSNDRFECPCHGSKFQGNGSWIEGPAPRGLDRFPVVVTYTDGSSVSTASEGGPVVLDSSRTIASIAVDTGAKISGPPH
ncbi:MAG: Rieske (2Fe-2S) protein [Phototrophicaceae bacterium]